MVGNWLINQVDFITNTRIKNAAYLDRGLARIPGIKLPQRFDNRKLVLHLYIVFAERRDELVAQLKEAGGRGEGASIPCRSISRKACASTATARGDFPVTDRHAATMISFPAHEHLTAEQLAYTCPDGRRVLWGLRWRSITFPYVNLPAQGRDQMEI